MKVLSIILGILLLLGGVYCILTPIETYAALSWLIGLSMVVEGVASIITWSDRRKNGLADGWTLAGAIVSLLLGIVVLGSFAAKIALDLFLAYIIAGWLVFAGIMRVAAAIQFRGNTSLASTSPVPVNWVALLCIGIIMIILGVLCIFNPLAVMCGVGFLLGLSIAFTGAGFIVIGAMA